MTAKRESELAALTWLSAIDRETAEALFMEVCDDVINEAQRLLSSRGEQYNDGGIAIYQYALYGERSYLHEVWKNTLRLMSMCEQEDFGESGDNPDTFISKCADTINYIRFLAAIHTLRKRMKGGEHDSRNIERGDG